MNKIMVLSRDPGGANTVIPVIPKLISCGFDVAVYGKDTSLDKYKKSCISAKDITDILPIVELKEMIDFVKKEAPSLVLTGTSANDRVEMLLYGRLLTNLESPLL